MPAKSLAQQRYMAGCAKNPEKMKGSCPSKTVAEEYANKPKGKKLPEKAKGRNLGRE